MKAMFVKVFGSARLLRLALVLVVAIAMLTISETVAHGYVFWEPATHEIGFALLVSFIVWSMFEFHRSQEAESEWSERIDRISKNVFFEVLGKDVPRELLNEARGALDTSVLRTNWNVTYTLRDATFEVSPGNQAECVLLVAVMACEMRNISQEPAQVRMGVGLPNPVHPALKALTRVNSFIVSRAAGPVELDHAQAGQEFAAQLATTEQIVRYNVGDVALGPGETVTVRADYVMAKEPEDTELLQTLYPSDGLTVTVMDTGEVSRRFVFAKAIHRKGIENQSSSASPGTKVFRVGGYLLPHQGVLIWWKKAPPGEQQQLPIGQ